MTAAVLLTFAPAVLSVSLAHPAVVPVAPMSLMTAAARAVSRSESSLAGSPLRRGPAPQRDSLRNGAIIGAVAGAGAGAILASYGCGVGDLLAPFPEEESCAMESLVGAAVGAGLGTLVGAGVDALLQRAPGPGVRSRARPRGLQVRVRF